MELLQVNSASTPGVLNPPIMSLRQLLEPSKIPANGGDFFLVAGTGFEPATSGL
jgi:hypothetical protein